MNQANSANLQVTGLVAGLAFSLLSVSVQTASPVESNTAKPERRIVVSIADRQLALLEGHRVVKIYNVAVGAPISPSPEGEFQIVRRLENPTYYQPGVVIGPGKNNPLGPRWIGLDVKGFGIHGTNRPDSIGKNATHGCIRLRNRDIEELFARVQVGDRISIIGERNEQVARQFGHAPVAERLLAKNEASAAVSDEGGGKQ